MEKEEKKVKSTNKKTSNKTSKKNNSNQSKNTKKKTKTSEQKAGTKTQKKVVANNKKQNNEVTKKAKKGEIEKDKAKKINSEKLKETLKDEKNNISEISKNDNLLEVPTGIEEKNNKTALIAVLTILLIIIGVCVYYQLDNKEKNDSDISESESSKILDKFYEYYNNKKAKIIYYASSSCGYCQLQSPIMEQIKEDYDIDYLDIDSTKLTNSDKKNILEKLGIDHATPTTVVVKNGKVIGKNIGYVDGGEMVDFLIKNGILKDDAVYTPEANLTFIDFSEYEDLIEESDQFIVTIGQTGCSHCIKTKPVLSTIAKEYDITINYLNLTDMTETEQSNFFESLKEIGYDDEEFLASGSFGTPLTLIIDDGQIVSHVDGENSPAKFTKAFKKAGVISE